MPKFLSNTGYCVCLFTSLILTQIKIVYEANTYSNHTYLRTGNFAGTRPCKDFLGGCPGQSAGIQCKYQGIRTGGEDGKI